MCRWTCSVLLLATLLPVLVGCSGAKEIVAPPNRLADQLAGNDPQQRMNAAREIVGMQFVPTDAIPGLLRLLQDDDRQARLIAAEALSFLPNHDSQTHVAELDRLAFVEQDRDVRFAIQDTIRKIRGR